MIKLLTRWLKTIMAVGGGGSNVKGFRFFLSRVPRKASLGRGSLTGRSRGRMSAWEIKVRRVVE